MAEPDEHTELVSQPVTTIMRAPVFTVVESVVLLHALAAMLATGRRHLAVVDSLGQCHGVIGDRAVAAAWADDPSSMTHRQVGRLLDPRPSVVGTDATVGDVARRMHMDAVDAVVVIDRTGRPVGIVTGGDLISLLARAVPTASEASTIAPEAEDSPDEPSGAGTRQ
jgi:CBS domain-containing protein